ncbi:MAG: CobW family GTP-binding protein [Chloroflexaceae bacterium]
MHSDTAPTASQPPIRLSDAPVPLTILTGFLGAGKTTLLNRILQADHGRRVAVLINDFGSINIDTRLVVNIEGETINLANGCICCTMREDLLIAAMRLISNPEPPEYLLIEASGVSDPWAVAETFLLPDLRPLFQLDGVITVVDAEQAQRCHDYATLIVDQLAAADIVVLNKVDLVSAAELAGIKAWVRTIVPRARMLEAVHGNVPLQFILGTGRYRIPLELSAGSAPHGTPHSSADAQTDAHAGHSHAAHAHDHSAEFSTWSYRADRPFGLKALRKVLRDLPMSIFRAKGILWVAESPGRRAVLQIVGNRVMLTIGATWDDTPPYSELVMIGTPGGIDAATLTRQFDACLQAAPAAADLPAEQQWLREG